MVAAGAATVVAGTATGAAAKVTEAAVRYDSVRGATEVAVVDGAWAECSGRSGAGGTAAAVAAILMASRLRVRNLRGWHLVRFCLISLLGSATVGILCDSGGSFVLNAWGL